MEKKKAGKFNENGSISVTLMTDGSIRWNRSISSLTESELKELIEILEIENSNEIQIYLQSSQMVKTIFGKSWCG